MKLAPLLLTGSLALNVTLLVTLALRPALLPSALRETFTIRRAPPIPAGANSLTPAPSPPSSIPPLATFWATLDSNDLPTLISRLRSAGFSAADIRAIVNARVEALFSARSNARLGYDADLPFWRSGKNGFKNPGRMEEIFQLSRERSRLLRQLLGDDFFAGAGGIQAAAQRRQFGTLPTQKAEFVRQIEEDYAEMISQVRTAAQGITLPEDREKLALLTREKRADLAASLTPEELEAYDLRTSVTTAVLRQPLTYMDASEEEFRAIYRARQKFADVLSPPGGTTPEIATQRPTPKNKSPKSSRPSSATPATPTTSTPPTPNSASSVSSPKAKIFPAIPPSASSTSARTSPWNPTAFSTTLPAARTKSALHSKPSRKISVARPPARSAPPPATPSSKPCRGFLNSNAATPSRSRPTARWEIPAPSLP